MKDSSSDNKIDKILQVALKHHHDGKLSDATALYLQVLEIEPNNPNALHLLGMIAHKNGKYDLALDLLNKAILSDPLAPDFHNNLGLIWQAKGDFSKAQTCYQQAINLHPAFHMAHYNLADALEKQGKCLEAIACYQKAIELKPDYAKAYNNLGNILKDQGQALKAIDCYKKAAEFLPSYADAYYNLGVTYQDQQRLEEAIACYQKTIQLQPLYTDAYYNLGIISYIQSKVTNAITFFKKTIELKPDHADAHNNLGCAFKDQGRISDACGCFEKALEFKPDWPSVHSNLLFSITHLEGYDPTAVYERHLSWAKQHANKFSDNIASYNNDTNPNRRLRLGYVSPYFYRQPIAHFLEPILSGSNRSEFEITCYADVLKSDEITQRLQKLSDHWCPITSLDNKKVFHKIRDDKIDILIDLSGHIARNRILLFAYKPAPIQISYLYQATTGLAAMDYRITDTYADPIGMTEHCYSEELLRLPNSYWCYQPPMEAPEVSELPAINSKQITFACVNHLSKVGPSVIALWSQILQKVKQSQLMIFSHSGDTNKHIIQSFEKHGITIAQLLIRNHQSFAEYLKAYELIDITLDPFPYNGGTTTCESLWMGVPVITLAGNSCMSRGGVSILSNIGLKDLIAHTSEDYVQIAMRLATNLPNLQQLRSQLRKKMRSSPLMDAQAFTHNLEFIYREVWKKWCQKQK